MLAGENEHNLRFAADAAIDADSKTTLQLLMTTLNKTYKDHEMEINTKKNKTKIMFPLAQKMIDWAWWHDICSVLLFWGD